MDYVGLNHLGWMRRVLVDGVDVLPGRLADEERLARMEEAQVFGADWLRTLGVIPNEYLYYYYFNRDAVRRILESHRPEVTSCWRPRAILRRLPPGTPDHAAKLWTGAVDERGASYMAEAKGGVQGAPAVERERETDPRTWGMQVWHSGS